MKIGRAKEKSSRANKTGRGHNLGLLMGVRGTPFIAKKRDE